MTRVVLILAMMLAGASCKGIPDDGRYQDGAPNRGGAERGLPVTPYDPNAR